YVLEERSMKNTPRKPFVGSGKPVEVTSVDYEYLIPHDYKKLRGKRAVIFDDFTVTGSTLGLLKKQLQGGDYGLTVTTVALIAMKTAEISPDYEYELTDSQDIFIPWGHIVNHGP